MVSSVTNLGRNGLSDWIVQRFTAVILAAYTLFMLATLVANPDMDFLQWRELFDSTFVRVFSLITLLCLCAHAWIGLWTVSTDYLTVLLLGKKATFLRLAFQSVCAVLTLIYLVWGVQIFWGL